MDQAVPTPGQFYMESISMQAKAGVILFHKICQTDHGRGNKTSNATFSTEVKTKNQTKVWFINIYSHNVHFLFGWPKLICLCWRRNQVISLFY